MAEHDKKLPIRSRVGEQEQRGRPSPLDEPQSCRCLPLDMDARDQQCAALGIDQQKESENLKQQVADDQQKIKARSACSSML